MNRRTQLSLLLALALLLTVQPVAANPIEPPWIHDLIQNGETVEVTLYHTYLNSPVDQANAREELLTLARFGPAGEVKVLFDERIFTLAEPGMECDVGCDLPNAESCADDPDCADCDDDGIPECPPGVECVFFGCESVFVDDCAPPGELTYALYSGPAANAVDFVDCDFPHEETLAVEDVGQTCPSYADEFDCHHPTGDSGCAVIPSRPTVPLSLALLALGIGCLSIARRNLTL